MKLKFSLILLLVTLLLSCEKYGYFAVGLGGSQSPIGEVGTEFSFSNPYGVSDPTATVTDLEGGVSAIDYSVRITDSKLLTLASYITVANLSGNTLSGQVKAKFTSEGIETQHKSGKFTLVKYNAKVGDKYTLKTDDSTITREVVSVSNDDDYYWGGMLIKTIQVEETGHSTPGVTKIKYVLNHKFGLVSAYIYLVDGSYRAIDVYCSKTN
jgi:hypothetical protein